MPIRAAAAASIQLAEDDLSVNRFTNCSCRFGGDLNSRLAGSQSIKAAFITSIRKLAVLFLLKFFVNMSAAKNTRSLHVFQFEFAARSSKVLLLICSETCASIRVKTWMVHKGIASDVGSFQCASGLVHSRVFVHGRHLRRLNHTLGTDRFIEVLLVVCL